VLVEACVTSVDEAAASVAAGAGRLELCAELEVGGLTPPPALLREVKRRVDVPVFAMARPRAGSFVFAPDEVADTLRAIGEMIAAGADGVVVGFLDAGGGIDVDATARAVDAAGTLPVTFHRAFDHAPDLAGALGALARLGVPRVLTAGGLGRARDNADTLAALRRAAGGRVEILAGGTVRGDHVRHLVAHTGVAEVHARANAVPGIVRALGAGG
jgi:copper homeostasis protein